MLSETIKSRLAERFAAPLPEFHKRRIVFWRDEGGEFGEEINELDRPDVRVVKLTDKNHFAVKKLLTTDDLTSDYLIYDPLAYEKDHEDDWLLDIKLYSARVKLCVLGGDGKRANRGWTGWLFCGSYALSVLDRRRSNDVAT